jgi:hypothetical protein
MFPREFESSNKKNHEPPVFGVIYIICSVPDGRLLLFRRARDYNGNETNRGWSLTLTRTRRPDIATSRLIDTSLYSNFGLKTEIINALQRRFLFGRTTNLNELGYMEVYQVKFSKTITLHMSSLVEAKAMSLEDLKVLTNKSPSLFTKEAVYLINNIA